MTTRAPTPHTAEELAALLEPAWDPETTRQLSRLGIASGWRAMTTGNVSLRLLQWMSAAVGPAGWVVTSDPAGAAAAGVSNVRAIAGDPFPPHALDLAHARMTLGAPAGVVAQLSGALRPGGWLVVEALDWATVVPDGSAAADRVRRAVSALVRAGGPDPSLGRRLPALLRRAGLRDVEAIGHVLVGDSAASPVTEVVCAALRAGRAAVTAAGSCTDGDVAEVVARAADGPGLLSPAMVTAWGRLPAVEAEVAARGREGTRPAAGGQRGGS